MSPEVHVEPDAVRGRSLWGTIAAVVVVTGACIVAAGIVLRADESSLAVGPARPIEAPRQIHHGAIESERLGPKERARARETLDHWSWVDRERGIVAMPIDRAIERIVRSQVERRGRGGP
jgi:hypothetical protein